MRRILLLSCFIVVTACSSGVQHLTPEGKSVKISNVLPPTHACKEMGEVFSNASGDHDSLEKMIRSSRNQLRNESARRNGNYVHIETNNTASSPAKSYVVMSGTAYRCTAPTPDPLSEAEAVTPPTLQKKP